MGQLAFLLEVRRKVEIIHKIAEMIQLLKKAREVELALSLLAWMQVIKAEENLNLVKVAPQQEEEIRKLQEVLN